MPLLSVVSGTYNEEENVEEFVHRVQAALAQLPKYDYEIIIIDNASTDRTVELLKKLAQSEPRLRVIVNARNFGHIRSPYHALLQARGDAAVFLASDLQDPPELIRDFVAQWELGAKAVIGKRSASEETALFAAVRSAYYRLVQKVAEIQVIEKFTGFGLYDRQIVDYCRGIEDPYPYFRGLISEIGLPVAEIEYQRPARKRGITKNNFYTLYDLAMLGITSHSKLPLRLATMMGFCLSFLSLLVGFAYLVYKLLFWDRFTAGMAPVVIGLFLFSSVQLFFVGILGEYIGVILTHVRKLPHVVEKERINF